MASSDNLPSIEPWAFRTAFPDSWIAETYARDTETLTKALHKSLYAAAATDSFNPFIGLLNHHDSSPPTPTASTLSGSAGSDPDREASALPRRPRTTTAPTAAVTGPTGKVSKRKSRASKRSQTTFITADPANFRQMVQQVTGVRFGDFQLPMAPVLKPEPYRPPTGGCSAAAAASCLPTLDTSALLLDQHQMLLGSVAGPGVVVGSGPQPSATQPQPLTVAAESGSGVAGLGFDTFSSFPTLESWKVV